MEKPTHCNQRIDPRTRECPRATRKNNMAKANKSPTQCGRKRSKRVGSIHPHPLQNSPHSPPVYRGEVNLPSSWVCCSHRGAVRQDNQEEEKGCGEAELPHLHSLAGGLLRMLGMDGACTNILAERLDQAMRKGVRQGRSWVSPVYCEIPPPNHASCFCLQGSNVQ